MIRMNTDAGQITVDSAVYTNIAGFAATNCFGVKGMAVRSMTQGGNGQGCQGHVQPR